jgi:hypothetical protein
MGSWPRRRRARRSLLDFGQSQDQVRQFLGRKNQSPVNRLNNTANETRLHTTSNEKDFILVITKGLIVFQYLQRRWSRITRSVWCLECFRVRIGYCWRSHRLLLRELLGRRQVEVKLFRWRRDWTDDEVRGCRIPLT